MHHDRRGQRRFVIQRYPGRFGQRLPQDDPFRRFAVQTRNVVPRALYEQDIPGVHFRVFQAGEQVFVLAADAQYVDVVLFAQSGFADRRIDQPGGRRQQDLGDPDVVEIERAWFAFGALFGRMGVHQFEPAVGGESLHVFKKPHQVEDIPVAERRIGVGQLLADRFQEMRLGRLDSADFDQVEVVLLLDAQFPHRLSSGRRAGGYPDPEQAVGELVFADQFAERFSGLPLLFFLFFRAEEPSAQRDQHDDSGQDTYQADRSERKEGQRLVARVGQYILDNEVRGSPDQRQHTAHAACECQRHQYAADVHVRIGCETHHDREH